MTRFRGIVSPRFQKEVLWLLGLTIGSAGYGTWIFRESFNTLFFDKIPLGGDGASTGFFIRLVLESSWLDFFNQHIYSNQFGWPGKIDYTSYPTGQMLELTVIKFLATVFGLTDPSNIIHISAVLKIIPISLSGYVLLRVFKLPRAISVLGAVAFSTSTFNLIRAEGHFFLGMTWSVPLAIAALFLSYKFSLGHSGETRRIDRTQLYQIGLLSIAIGFSNFYFSLISLILNGVFLLGFLLTRLVRNHIGGIPSRIVVELKSYFKNSLGFIISAGSIVIGLSIQLIPIIYRSSKSPALSGIADRSPTESIVFSGSLESYFFDFSSAMLKLLNRREILNFTSTRISWEGSQLGALTGFIGFTILLAVSCYLIVNLWMKGVSRDQAFLKGLIADERTIFLITLITILFFLYLPNPVNFGISQVLPQLRAWGRVSVFLTFTSIALLAIVISRTKRHSVVGGFLILVLALLPFFEANEFRSSRAAGVDISRVANEAKSQRLITLDSLKSLLPAQCPIFQVPLYPYPEFDRPDDAVGDYAAIMLPAEDLNYFRWSSPAIKNSYDWISIQPLVSENPNFARVSPTYSIEYAKALGACAVLVDRAMLTSTETVDFDDNQIKPECKFDLPGEKFNNGSRFQVIKLLGELCRIKVSKEVMDFASSNSSGRYLWKIDQAYGIEYREGVQIFSTSAAINTRVIRGLNVNKQNTYLWKVSFYDESKREIFGSEISVCKLYINQLVQHCGKHKSDSKGRLEIPANSQELSDGLKKYEFKIENTETIPKGVFYWGLSLYQK